MQDAELTFLLQYTLNNMVLHRSFFSTLQNYRIFRKLASISQQVS